MASDDPLPSAPAAHTPPAAAPRQNYRQLPGRAATLRLAVSSRKKLYLGDDHLLQVDTVFFVEHYRRFAYADIQSLLLRRTMRGLVINVGLGVAILAFGLFGVSINDDVGRIVAWGIGTIAVALLAVNALRGTTCHCQLETAIGAQELLSLSRLRPALRAVAFITERVAAAQGRLSADEARERVDALLAGRGRGQEETVPVAPLPSGDLY